MRKKRGKLDNRSKTFIHMFPPSSCSSGKIIFPSFSKASFSSTLYSPLISPSCDFSNHLIFIDLLILPTFKFSFWLQIKFTIPFPKTVLRTFISFRPLHFPLLSLTNWKFSALHPVLPSHSFFSHWSHPLPPPSSLPQRQVCNELPAARSRVCVIILPLEICRRHLLNQIPESPPKICQVLVVLSSLFSQQTHIEHLSSTVRVWENKSK